MIFTTGHTKYGYQAFEHEASAFLLKPYNFTKFAQTIEKLFKPEEQTSLPTEISFYVGQKSNLQKVYVNEVIAVESRAHSVIIHSLAQKTVVNCSLAEIKKMLPDDFIQVHRSFVIAEKHIRQVEGNVVRLNNDIYINIGRNYKDGFEKFISKKILNFKN